MAAPGNSLTAETLNDSSTRPALRHGSTEVAVLRLQILLDRAHFSVGQIDGDLGTNTEIALLGFRATRNLAAGEGADVAVWDGLNQDSSPVLVPYTITAADLKGPFVKIPTDMLAKSKLKYLGYSSALEGLAEKFHTTPVILRRLNPRNRFVKVGEKLQVPNVRTNLETPTARIVVSKSAQTVAAVDAGGAVLAQYPSSIGSEHDPLPIGEWKVTGVLRNPPFHYNPDLFWDAKDEHTKATIAPGPRNPVGVVWIDLSKEHYGIHGTPAPGTVGYGQSHGCIRLTNWDAMELAGMVKAGVPVSLVE